MRFIFIFTTALFFTVQFAQAQVRDSVFKDYQSYASFIEKAMKARDVTTLLKTLGGRNDFSDAEFREKQQTFQRIWPRDFENALVFRQEDLGNGIMQEGRIFWVGESYAYFYAVLHQRETELVVLNFNMHTNIKEVMNRF